MMAASGMLVRFFFALWLALSILFVPVHAFADDAQARAAKAFDEGERAFAAGQYHRAAISFEEAYAASPHSATLFNAAKARTKGGELALAATTYARIEAESSSPRDRDDARAAREALLPKIGRVQVTGDFDTATIDGEPIGSSGTSYVEAGSHTVIGKQKGRTVRQVVFVGLGAVVEARLVAEVEPPPAPAPEEKRPPPDRPTPAPSGLPPIVTYILGGTTIAMAGVTTWSGIDTLSTKSRFNQTGADADLDAGLSQQTRTNVLLGVTVGLAVVTGIVAIFFTDWTQ